MVASSPRQTAQERREAVVEAAYEEFGKSGLHATSTEVIARRVGISQPYLFRLFGSKKELFLAAVDKGFRDTRDAFERAVDGIDASEAALEAMGAAYVRLLDDRRVLRMQMQAYAACDDPEVRALVRREFGRLFEYIDRIAGGDAERARDFMARGMLLNVMASMGLVGEESGWAGRLAQVCRE